MIVRLGRNLLKCSHTTAALHSLACGKGRPLCHGRPLRP